VNRAKLPDGVPFLVREAEKQGIKFGIWIEPEMVNPKSELYEQHPDWVIKQEQRPEIYFRNQLVLDLATLKCKTSFLAWWMTCLPRTHAGVHEVGL